MAHISIYLDIISKTYRYKSLRRSPKYKIWLLLWGVKKNTIQFQIVVFCYFEIFYTFSSKMIDFKICGGLVLERLLHKKCHSATVGLNLCLSIVYQSFSSRKTMLQFQMQSAGPSGLLYMLPHANFG